MKTSHTHAALVAAIALALAPSLARAQHAGHAAPPAAAPQPAKKKPSVPAAKPANAKKAATPVDHAAMGHAAPTPSTPAADEMDHAAMGHEAPAQAQPQAVDHAAMGHDMPSEQEPAGGAMDHAAMGHDMPATERTQAMQGMDHAAMGHAMPAPTQPREPIPPITDADRQAAFPDVAGHAVHDRAVNSYFLFNRLEAWDADPGTAYAWEGQGWIGGDINRLWLRSEGERVDGETESADLEVLYGRGIARWWDLVAGVRHDFKPGESQSFAAIGVVGLAPQKFEVEATAYIGERGQTAARFEAEYEVLLTNRLILQPLVEVNVFGKNDPARGIGSGLSSVEAGLRLRYEFTRKFAPYIGVVRERAFGKTADLRRDEGEDIDDTRVVFGLRTWF